MAAIGAALVCMFVDLAKLPSVEDIAPDGDDTEQDDEHEQDNE